MNNYSPERAAFYAAAEASFPTVANLRSVEAYENNERLVNADFMATRTDVELATASGISPSTGNRIYVREAVADRLITAAINMRSYEPSCEIVLCYGYRSPAVQLQKFEEVKTGLGLKERFDIAALEIVHRMLAVPDVAGHPTGGAVDVTLFDNYTGKYVDMGTPLYDFSKDSYAKSPFVPEEALYYRQKLSLSMKRAGFVGFEGEWWHYSYGDREWAFVTQQPRSLYSPVPYPSKLFSRFG